MEKNGRLLQKIIFMFLKNKKQTFNMSFNPLSTNLTTWSNTLKQFVGSSRRIILVCLVILWGWHLQGSVMA